MFFIYKTAWCARLHTVLLDDSSCKSVHFKVKMISKYLYLYLYLLSKHSFEDKFDISGKVMGRRRRLAYLHVSY